MKKLEGILTVFGVFVIIGLPLFLMIADIKNIPADNASNDYIRVQSYAEDIVMHVDDYEESYEVLDGEEPRSINSEIDFINDDVVPLGLSPLIIDKPLPIGDRIEYIEQIETVPIFVEINDLSDGLITDNNEEMIMIDFRDIILDDNVPQGLDIPMPTYEEVGDDRLDTIDEFVELVDYDMPEALVVEDYEEVYREEFYDDDVDFEEEGMEAIPKTIIEEIEYEGEITSEIFNDDDVPEALLGTGAENINVETVEENGITTHNVTMEYVSYDELGNEVRTYVAFSY